MFLCSVPFAARECHRNARFPFTTSQSLTRMQLAFGLFLRAFFGWISMAWQHMALEHLPLGDVAAFAWTAPLFTALLGWLTLGEKMGAVEVAAACSIVVGVVFISRPPILSATGISATIDTPADEVGLALCAGTAVTIAITICIIRRLAPLLHWSCLTPTALVVFDISTRRWLELPFAVARTLASCPTHRPAT